MTHFIAVLYFCINLIFIVWAQSITNKICTDKYDKDACSQISRGQEFACTENTPSLVDCFLNIDRGEPQFSIVNPEEAFLAAPLISDNVIVVGEVKEEFDPYQTVVVIRKHHRGGFEGLKGKSFCHPGFDHDEEVTRYVLEEFENKVLTNVSFCNAINGTLLEKRIHALSNFFGSSCRPGEWTEDEVLDAELKTKYSTLCDLCGDKQCSVSYQKPFSDTLKCLVERGGYVALSTIRESSIFFNQSENHDRFQYICPNGTVTNGSNPCTWTSQLRRLVVTGRKESTITKNFIQAHLMNNNKGLTEALRKVLVLNKASSIEFIGEIPLKQYVAARRTVPSNTTTRCDLSVKWCTVSDSEQSKCLWLQQASLNTGLWPLIECKQTEDHLLCLKDIATGVSDIAFSDADYGYTALKKGLSTVAYVETRNEQLSPIFIVIKKSSSIQTFKDLEGKSACFPRFGGKEWLAFIDVLRKENVLPISCNYGELFSQFVGDSCVPDAKSNEYEISISEGNQKKLCNQCMPVSNMLPNAYCNANENNKFFGSEGALKCLESDAGEYAVISLDDISDPSNIKYQNFVVLNRNNSRASYQGLQVDENAALTTIAAGRVVIKNDSDKKNDTVLLLREIEKEFGYKLWKFFKAFEAFDNQKDLLFPDSTPGLTFTGTQIKYVENFKRLLEYSETCTAPVPSTSNPIQPVAFLIIVATLMLY